MRSSRKPPGIDGKITSSALGLLAGPAAAAEPPGFTGRTEAQRERGSSAAEPSRIPFNQAILWITQLRSVSGNPSMTVPETLNRCFAISTS
jgi:hypothetical protein